jgi:ABC-2 type transport system permease protein
MNHSLFWDLVRKDLAIYRFFTLGTLAICAVALVMITQGAVLFYIGSVTLCCAFILLIIFLAQMGIVAERKERVHHFVLSLPITGQQYVLAKLLALSIAFFVPFLLGSGVALLMIGTYEPSIGFLPYATTILLYFPLYFAVYVSVALSTKSEGAAMAPVLFFNIAINLFIPGLMRIPSVAATMGGTEAVWTSELLLIIALEVGVSVLAIALLLIGLRKKSEFL